MQNSFTEATLADLAKSISCLQRPDDMAGYLHDASNAHAGGRPDMVFRPESPEQVADIVRACHKEGRALTIQGGRTGLAGGAVPYDGDRSEERSVEKECVSACRSGWERDHSKQ